MIQADAVKFIGRRLVREINHVYREAGRHPGVGHTVAEEMAVRLGVLLVEPLLLLVKALRIGQGVHVLGLRAKGVYFDEIYLGNGVANLGFPQPLLPTAEDQFDLNGRRHPHQLVAPEDPLRRMPASQAREVNLQVAVVQCLGHQGR